MRGAWTPGELRENHLSDWVFTPSESRRLHEMAELKPMQAALNVSAGAELLK